MELDISVEHRTGYLAVAARGPWDLSRVKDHMIKVQKASEEAGLSRVLIDFRMMDPPSQQIDRFHAGVHAAAVWKPPMRVAGIWFWENIDRFAEDTAVNRGAVFRMFTDEPRALAWLLDEDGSG